MPKIISFSWTSPALITDNKSCTRRDWDPDYAETFRTGQILYAYDRSPRAHGNRIATIQLKQQPVWQPLNEMPDDDYVNEGFAWMFAHPDVLPKTIEQTPRDHFVRSVCSREGFERWRQSGEFMWTIRFALIELTEEGHKQKAMIAGILAALGQTPVSTH